MKQSCTKISYKKWWEKQMCVNYHSYNWIDDNREESIDAILENRDTDPSWYCPKCDMKLSKRIYKKKPKNYTSDTGPR